MKLWYANISTREGEKSYPLSQEVIDYLRGRAKIMAIRKGTIVTFRGSWGSGLGELVVDEILHPKGEVKRVGVYCDNGATVRALQGCFGNLIGKGHAVDNAAIAGKEIYFSVDDLGVLEGFTSTDDAPPEMERIYEEGATP